MFVWPYPSRTALTSTATAVHWKRRVGPLITSSQRVSSKSWGVWRFVASFLRCPCQEGNFPAATLVRCCHLHPGCHGEGRNLVVTGGISRLNPAFLLIRVVSVHVSRLTWVVLRACFFFMRFLLFFCFSSTLWNYSFKLLNGNDACACLLNF